MDHYQLNTLTNMYTICTRIHTPKYTYIYIYIIMHVYHNNHNVYYYHYMSTSIYIYIYVGMHAYISQPNLDTNVVPIYSSQTCPR